MGIPRLNSFVKHNVPLKKVNLRKFNAIVIDGNNIYFNIYPKDKTSWKYGGEYPQFYKAVENFLEKFIQFGLRVIVVLDGLMEPDKLDSSRKNKLGSMKRLAKGNGTETPLLKCQTFIDVLLEMTVAGKVEMFVSDGDGDRDAAALANKYRCPVLSDDSDFFMYELTCGVIPFYSLNLQTGECSLYTVDLLQKTLNIENAHWWFRFLVPAMYGNDYLEPIKDPPGSGNLMHHVDRYLSGICEPKLKENFKAARLQYANPTQLSYTNFKSKIACDNLPEWVINAYSKGSFHPFLLNVKRDGVYLLPTVVEDIGQESAWRCCRYIRQRMYAIIEFSHSSVKEVIRKTSSIELGEELVLPVYINKFINIHSISSMTVGERRWHVVDILTNYRFLPKELKKTFEKMDDKWKLPIVASHYWYRNAGGRDMEHLAKSLLLGFLYCSGKVECRSLPAPSEDPEIVHNFAKWQCVYHDAMALNCLAKECFTTTSPARLFSGHAVMSFAASDTACLQQGSIHVPDLYCKMLELVTFEISSTSSGMQSCIS